jgi:hypothetical protein
MIPATHILNGQRLPFRYENNPLFIDGDILYISTSRNVHHILIGDLADTLWDLISQDPELLDEILENQHLACSLN